MDAVLCSIIFLILCRYHKYARGGDFLEKINRCNNTLLNAFLRSSNKCPRLKKQHEYPYSTDSLKIELVHCIARYNGKMEKRGNNKEKTNLRQSIIM